MRKTTTFKKACLQKNPFCLKDIDLSNMDSDSLWEDNIFKIQNGDLVFWEMGEGGWYKPFVDIVWIMKRADRKVEITEDFENEE